MSNKIKKIEDYDFPADLKSMDTRELELLCAGIRDFLVSHVSETGGHLSSNLGVVELSVALHKVFDSPSDKLIWDVGHQSYVHKILTGRADRFGTLRQTSGLAGFPKSSESPHDVYDTGHSSTSLSAAAGMAAARDLKGENFHIVATIGDGALTGGMAFEALNNIGISKSRIIVIINDNGMSISPNVGGLSEHLARLRTSRQYRNIRDNTKRFIENIPLIGPGAARVISNTKNMVKYSILSGYPGGIIFEELGFTYVGPVDGHDVNTLVSTLSRVKEINGPVIVHVITKKGKGYRNAERDPEKFHGIDKFEPETGTVLSVKKGPSFSESLGRELVLLAKDDPSICAVTAAMGTSVGFSDFRKSYPDRYFDVGIAEQHAVTFSAGLAKGGMRPVTAIYSSFLQRAYDQIIEDVCLQNLPVIFAVDRAGCVGPDGATHHGMYDIAYLMSVPGIEVLAPASTDDLRAVLRYAVTLDGPCAIRYPRGGDVLPENLRSPDAFCDAPQTEEAEAGPGQDGESRSKDAGKGETVRNIRICYGSDCDIWAVGTELATASAVRDILSERGFSAGIVLIKLLKPFDMSFPRVETGLVCTIEDGTLSGGFGEHIKSILPCETHVINFGWPDMFIEHGSTGDLRKKYGLDAGSIAERITEHLEGEKKREA